jgi:hypothetical protein
MVVLIFEAVDHHQYSHVTLPSRSDGYNHGMVQIQGIHLSTFLNMIQ